MGHQTWDMRHGTWNPADIGDKTSDILTVGHEIGQKNRTRNWTKKSHKKLNQKSDRKIG